MNLLTFLCLTCFYRLCKTQNCENCTNSEKSGFMLLEYNNEYFFASTRNCVCRYNMRLEEQECVKISGNDNNYDALLLAVSDPAINSLILCGTDNHGICEMKNFTSLCMGLKRFPMESGTIYSNTTSVASSSPYKMIAFSSWLMNSDKNETVLYIAALPRKDWLSPPSVRSLQSEREFQLFKPTSMLELVDNMTIRKEYANDFEPISGFSYNGVAYFLTNQISEHSKNQTAKLIRLCQRDTGNEPWLSYMDIKMKCSNINLLQHAMLMRAGRNFKTFTFTSAQTNESDVLLSVFSEKGRQAVCIHTFEAIRRQLTLADSLTTNRYLKPPHPKECGKRKSENFCNASMECRNFISTSTWHLSEVHLMFSDEAIATMATTRINGDLHSLFLIASPSQNISVFYIGGTTKPKAISIRNITVNEDVVSLKVIDDVVYILTSSGLQSASLYNDSDCSKYPSAFQCVAQSDPFCGWSRTSTKCTIRRNSDIANWIPIETNTSSFKSISVDSIHPRKGPLSGGTPITLKGTSFDLYEEITVTVGNMACSFSDNTIRNSTTLTCLTPKRTQPEFVNVTFSASDANRTEVDIGVFQYLEDPTVSGISPNRSFASGGRSLTVHGSNFDVIQNPRLKIVGENITEGCDHTQNSSIIVCTAPEATKELKEKLEGDSNPKRSTDGEGCDNKDVLCVDVEFKMDGVNSSLLRQTLEIVRDPVFYNFTEEGMTREYSSDDRSIVIKGDRINISAIASDFHVTIGRERCDVLASKVFRYELHCLPPGTPPLKVFNISMDPEVQVRLGYIDRHVGFLRYLPPKKEHYLYLYSLISLLVIVVIVLVVVGVLLRRRSRRAVKKLQNDMADMEMRIQTEFRQAFADLQTDMTDITGELVETGLPYNKFPVYAFQILFPADDVTLMTSHKIFRYPEISIDVTDADTALSELDSLFSNKFFVLSVVNTLEQQKKLSISEKSAFAGYLAAGMLQNLTFFSQITKDLLEQYVEDVVSKKKHKSLFRRYESITEKLTGIWMGICLHQHLLKGLKTLYTVARSDAKLVSQSQDFQQNLSHRSGSALVMLVKAMQTVMEKSPIDAVTDAARATLSYDQLLLSQVDKDSTIKLKVQINEGDFECTCPVLECDTIAQVKAKCLGYMYKKDPASVRPTKDDVDLQWHCGQQGRLILQEEDTCPADDNHVKLMTLADYHVTDGSVMELLNRRRANEDEDEYMNYQNDQNQLSQSEVYLLIEDQEEETDEPKKEPNDPDAIKYHLVKPEEETLKSKVLPEAHLHKLLQTKMNVKQFVDELVDSALDKKDIPVVVKYLFSVLEDLSSTHGVDQDTLLSWKNNSYSIRFWGLLISRPKIVFDIDTPYYLQPSLDIVASTFIDSFSPPQTLSKNSAPHKLLFFKDLEEYRSMVTSFHRGVSKVPVVDEREMVKEMHKLTYTQNFTVNRTSIFYEIYKVILQYKKEILEGLEEDKDTGRLNLAEKLEHVMDLMDS